MENKLNLSQKHPKQHVSAGKEGLYHITRRAAERLNSSVLLANARSLETYMVGALQSRKLLRNHRFPCFVHPFLTENHRKRSKTAVNVLESRPR